MCVKAIDWAYSIPLETACDRAVLVALANCRNFKTGRCNPTLVRLISLTLFSERSVLRSLITLERLELISVIRAHRRANAYTLNTDEILASTPPLPEHRITPSLCRAEAEEEIPEPAQRQPIPARRQPSTSVMPVKHTSMMPVQPEETQPERTGIEPEETRASAREVPPNGFLDEPIPEPGKVVAIPKPTDHPAVLIWNDVCGSFGGRVVRLSPARAKLLKARMRDCQDDPEQWRAYCQMIADSDFCRGESDRGWVASFDWAIKEESMLRVAEGKYRNRERKSQTGYAQVFRELGMKATDSIDDFFGGEILEHAAD